MKTAFAFWFGALVEEISSYEHWFGDPHSPIVVISSWLLVGGTCFALRRFIWSEEF